MTVKKRHIYYISGFDPRGASYYQRLYVDEAKKQAAIGGLHLQVGERKRVCTFSSSWDIESKVENQTVSTTYEFLQWDDIVRANWGRNEVRIWLNYIKAAWIYISSGTLKEILRVSWPLFVTSLFPLVALFIIGCLAISCLIFLPRITIVLGLSKFLGWIIAVASFGGILQVSLQVSRLMEKRFNSYWLLRIYAFSAQQGLGKLNDLENRLNQFAQHIVNQTNLNVDEVLIVGHSTGTIMATSVLARILKLESTWLLNSKSTLGLLTLGQCIPMVSMLPEARRYRDDLALLSQCETVNWIDFTAPTDGACFALVDPITVSGLSQVDPQQPKPKLLSPRFARLFSPQSYAKIKRDWYRNHFQYIMSSECAHEYDYFAITAGPLTLKNRHQSQPSVQNYQRPNLFK